MKDGKHIYGLIGYPLGHSFSPTYFEAKFKKEEIKDSVYLSFPLEDISELGPLLDSGVKGLNVTIPYKEKVFPYLTDISPDARAIGAINTIRIDGDRIIGYNTDFTGFEQSLIRFCGKKLPSKALVLGSGGSSKAIAYALNRLKISYTIVSRKETFLHYQELTPLIIDSHRLIINTTPVGMYPHTDECPMIPYNLLSEKHFLYDLIYNPEKTLFLEKGAAQNCKITNGYEMLTLQAEHAWQIWNQQ